LPRVEVEILVDAPAGRIYEVVADMERFPDFMADVESVTTLERGEGYTVTAWTVKARGARLRWTERDEFFPDRIAYRQIKGDLRRFEGEWQLVPLGPHQTRVTLITDFELGLPMLAALFNPVAAHLLRENARSMLASVGRAVAADDPSS
jgi:coenzyme Q-binding protein COQ10